MQLECRYAHKYKGRRPPKCDCLTCRVIFLHRMMDYLMINLDRVDALEQENRARKAGYPGYD